MPTGGQVLIDCLAQNGVGNIFTVPGESFLPVLDALHGETRIRPITCRTEGGAALMAEATGKLTGRCGVALVTRGPGAANALPGLYVAHQDASPMLLLVGLPPRNLLGCRSFQDIDIEDVFGSLAKWCAVVPEADRIASYLSRGVSTALSGRNGPVVLGLPEDVLAEITGPAAARVGHQLQATLSTEQLAVIRTLLAHAERPLVIVGGSSWSPEASRGLAKFAERFDLPVISSFRRQSHFDNRHRCYVGHAGLNMEASVAAAMKVSDAVIAIGTRLGDITTRTYTLLNAAEPGQQIVHIAPDAGQPDATHPQALPFPVSAAAAALALADLETPGKKPPWPIWRRDLRKAFEDSLKPLPTPGNVQLEEVMTALSRLLPDDAIIASGAGNYAAFLHRYFVFKGFPTQLAPTSGSMGYGVPAAIAAKLACPDRRVVALAGDGCFQMSHAELLTALQFDAPIIVIVANNNALGSIRMHQERRYPGRIVGTTLMNPDFVMLARSTGALAFRVERTNEFEPALRCALASNRTTLIELVLDIEAVSPTQTLTSNHR